MAQKFTDHIYPVLRDDDTLGNENRADLWDISHKAASVHDLNEQLTNERMGKIDKADLALAESHPVLLKAHLESEKS